MRKLARLVSGLILLAVLVVSLGFLNANDTPVALEFGSFVTAARPIALWIIAAFVIGGTSGLLIGLRVVSTLAGKVELGRLRAKVKKYEAAESKSN